MNTNKIILKEKYIILISSFIACISMFAIERFIVPSYLIKSSIKLVVFSLPIILYTKMFGFRSIRNQFSNLKFSKLKLIFIFAICVYLFIILLFFLLRDYIDLEVIRSNLLENINADTQQ